MKFIKKIFKEEVKDVNIISDRLIFEQEQIKEAIEIGIKREQLKKLIGNMMTSDLNELYNMLVVKSYLPTAEELVDSLSKSKEIED